MDDYRLVIVAQGDDRTSLVYCWLETPCTEHGSHMLRITDDSVPAMDVSTAHSWLADMTAWCAANLDLCDAQADIPDALSTYMEGLRG